jgi:hypothetical protein
MILLDNAFRVGIDPATRLRSPSPETAAAERIADDVEEG